MQAAAKTLGWDQGGGGGGGEQQTPQPGPPPDMTPIATGGQRGPNIQAPRAYAQQALAQQGFNLSPTPANMLPSTGGPPQLDQGPPGRAPIGYAPAGQASGMPMQGAGMGTTLNSPSQLQMAMLYGWPYGSMNANPMMMGSY
jgi:hypothetical protein